MLSIINISYDMFIVEKLMLIIKIYKTFIKKQIGL